MNYVLPLPLRGKSVAGHSHTPREALTHWWTFPEKKVFFCFFRTEMEDFLWTTRCTLRDLPRYKERSYVAALGGEYEFRD